MNPFSENIKIKVKKISEIIKNNNFISLGKEKPDYVEEDIIDKTNIENQRKITSKILNLSNNRNNNNNKQNNINIYEMSKNITLEDV